MAKAIYRKYRPKTFKEVSGQEHVVRTLQNQYASETVAHAYLFTGPRGVGKTTIARLLAKLVNCEKPKGSEPCNVCKTCEQIIAGNSLDVHEIDAASHTDVDNVRENIIKAVRFSPNQLKKKVYIIDEVHMLSASAFNALLKTLEEPPEHALFILATTEIHKVPETIISRCQRFDFNRIDAVELIKRLKKIVKNEGSEMENVVFEEIVKHAEGCVRDAESLLGQVLALGEKNIGLAEASLVLPTSNPIQVKEIVDHLHGRKAAEAIRLLNNSIEQGMDLRHFVKDIIHLLRDQFMEAVSTSKATPFFEVAIAEFLDAQSQMRYSHIPQLPIELAIVKICKSGNFLPTETKDFPQQGVDSGRPSSTKTSVPKDVSTPTSPDSNQHNGAVAETNQEIPEVVETVFDTVPVIDIEEVKKKWPDVYEQIKQCNASLPLIMKGCEVTNLWGDHVELAFDYELYVQTVNKDKNRLIIENVIEEVVGKRLKVKAVPSTKRAQNDDTIRNLMEKFGGNVV